jgi:ribose 5-phosphate isomerase B
MIYLGADHGGFALKEKIKKWLTDWGYDHVDLGAKKQDPADDYPRYAFLVGQAVYKNTKTTTKWREQAKGILVCRSAAGMVMAANKVYGVRAAAVFDEKSAVHCRQHNDANVMALSGDWLDQAEAKVCLKLWLETEFSYEKRHMKRLKQIHEYEEECGECCGGGCC